MSESTLQEAGRGRARILLGVLALIALVSWLAVSLSGRGASPTADGESVVEEFGPADRVQSEPFRARLLDGSSFDTEDLDGQVVVYNVWGSWCVPCAIEAPALAEVANDLAGRVTFVGINVRDNEAAARAFEREYDVPYASIVASDLATAMLSFQGAMATSAVPSTLVIDRQGRVAARAIGPVTALTLRALLTPVVDESQ